MQKRMSPLWIVALAVLLAATACGGSFSTANIEEVWTSSDLDGNSRTSTFGQDEVFYVQVDLRNAPDDTQLKATWIAVEAEGTEPNFLIQETDFVTGSGLVHFDLSNTNLWPKGSYKVEIFMNGDLQETVNFTVE